MEEELIFADGRNKSGGEESRGIIPEEIYSDVDSIIEKVRELNSVKYYFALEGNSPKNTIIALNASIKG